MSSRHLQPLASIDAELADKLMNDDTFRRRYIRFWAQNEVASEIRALRKARQMRQREVAVLTETGQSAISRIEKADYDGWTFKTLIGIAEVLKARLRITFEPIENVAMDHRVNAEAATAEHIGRVTDATALAHDIHVASGGATHGGIVPAALDANQHVELASGGASASLVSGMVM